MTTEAREVSAPDSVAAPTHVMSETGAARLAKLTPEQLAPPPETVTPGTQPEPVEEAPIDGQADRAAPRPEVDVSNIEPLVISEKYREVETAYREDVAAIAKDHGIAASEMNALYAFAGGMAAAEISEQEGSATISTGQTLGPDTANPSECVQRLTTRYGSMARAVIQAANREFANLPPSVQAWLNTPDDAGRKLGNSPFVVSALALRAFAKLSPAAATAEMERIKAGKEYWNGSKLEVDKVRMLQLVATGKKPEAPSAPQPYRGIVYRTGGSEPANPSGGTEAAAKLRKELTALSKSLYDQKGELSKDSKKRKAVVARRAEIQTQLEGRS